MQLPNIMEVTASMLCRGALIVIALAVSHWVQKPHIRPFLIYDASISQINTKGKNTVCFFLAGPPAFNLKHSCLSEEKSMNL